MFSSLFAIGMAVAFVSVAASPRDEKPGVRVGAAAVNLQADDTMMMAGIAGRPHSQGQEGELRAVAVVIEKPGETKLAIVQCDVLWFSRTVYDSAAQEISRTTGIPPEHILVNATHTHHAPATTRAHDWEASEAFTQRLRDGIVKAVQDANAKLEGGEARFYFQLGQENTIGANSRLLMDDGNVTWLNPLRESNGRGKPTGPFDPQLPVLDFRGPDGKTRALIYNHSTHTIGTQSEKNVRSAGFYGLAAQELERELGGIVSFLEGASGSTHNIAAVPAAECIRRLKKAILQARAHAQPLPVTRLAAIRRPFRFKVRTFDDAEEDHKIVRYTEKFAPKSVEFWRNFFSKMRAEMKDHQGEERETWLQALLIGDVAIVGVPAEYFTSLGMDIKKRSPFKHTYVAELANDWVGYIPDREGQSLGGYQTWMGLHSYAEIGTGERMADEAVKMLHELAGGKQASQQRRDADDAHTAAAQVELPTSAGKSPAEEQATFELADAALTIDLVAAEPDIESPVAIAWDPDGALFVAEMIGYPLAEGLSRVKRLEDRDRDGRYERVSVFADGLNFPSSVMPYRDGLLVADAPDILFFQDTDGDGRADVRRVEWTGFSAGVQQLRVNALHWGIDNWIYGANGRSDGEIRRPDAPKESAVSIRARDFRFHPITGEFEAITGQSQFGQVHDDWGNRLLSWNIIPVRHVVIPDRYVARTPELAAAAVRDIAAPDDTGETFPISPPPPQFNGERANYYNAMCGLTVLRGDALGSEYRGNAFVGESLSNLITRRVLHPDGPTFVSKRVEQGREFLASRDPWFHPVFLTTGPDGALYVVDFYRQLVEHPAYVASQIIRDRLDWRQGAEHGRIWRIRHKDAMLPKVKPLAPLPPDQLVALLNSPVGWQRDTAQRLLVERQAKSATPAVNALLTNGPDELGRLHALWTLHGLQSLSAENVAAALQDRSPVMRIHALRIADEHLSDSAAIAQRVEALRNDPDPRVRFQLAFTLGAFDESRRIPLLTHLVRSAPEDQWLQLAAISRAEHGVFRLVRELGDADEYWWREPRPQQVHFLVRAGTAIGQQANGAGLASLLDWLVGGGRAISRGQVALLAGAYQGAASRPEKCVQIRKTLAANQLAETITRHAEYLVTQSDLATDDRVASVMLMSLGESATASDALLALLETAELPAIQEAAARALADFNDAKTAARLYDHWPRYRGPIRRHVLSSSLRSGGALSALAEAMERGAVLPMELPTEIEAQLRRWNEPRLRAQFQRLLGTAQSPDRQQVIAEYQKALSLAGEPLRGARVFKEHCITCHTVQHLGREVGPDLSTVGGKASALILAEILDPSQRVSPDYLEYTVVMTSGRVLHGVIKSETAAGLTLALAEGENVSLAKADIDEITASGKSIMPDGMERKLDHQAMADLLQFLRQPQRALLEQVK